MLLVQTAAALSNVEGLPTGLGQRKVVSANRGFIAAAKLIAQLIEQHATITNAAVGQRQLPELLVALRLSDTAL